jgi:hypothetical protein
MNTEDKDLNELPIQPTENSATTPVQDQSKLKNLEDLQDDIIRNDTIPETNSDTPGSSGAFPVGAFDTSKDL